jgi:hypothetical protein
MAQELYVVRHGQRRGDVDPDWAATADRVHDPRLRSSGGVAGRSAGRPGRYHSWGGLQAVQDERLGVGRNPEISVMTRRFASRAT